jgi:hypothetical protein
MPICRLPKAEAGKNCLPRRAVLSCPGEQRNFEMRCSLLTAKYAGGILRRLDVAPNFYPGLIGVWRSVVPCWAVVAAVRGAEPSV